ncbi:MAG: hypothetical protein ACTSRH_06005 [Promethearchaeota archaeon]
MVEKGKENVEDAILIEELSGDMVSIFAVDAFMKLEKSFRDIL